ncbi:protein DEHYDRATION-INDUCED 19 homolog 7-like [Salvia hispanica]|uniref:protein DEHYDRATION-INDUCED 19 homolog 7-like n=1 Tax=Salvia hispanica TaxID=49212 RepID=UPI002009456F|nr:protein DEHYDRATION-INDUCED 19 homolog 7-like [Salvia hispanica]XP_047983372.1 protein DEHYDRATION-INDUCED 19 homolog 7-like [Salvia hispanica]
MADRLYRDLEIALSSFSTPCNDDYNEEDEESEEEYEGEEVNGVEIEGKSEELACPFCSEDFDVLGLCCHIDADHRMEVKPGICPVCAVKVRVNMASHVITHHESILKALCNKKHRSTRSRSSIYLLRKELQEKHLRAVKESPTVGSSSNAAADSMLLSFVNSPQPAYRPQITEAATPSEASLSGKSSYDDSAERFPPSLSTDRNIEMARRSEFVQGLLLSTILDDL